MSVSDVCINVPLQKKIFACWFLKASCTSCCETESSL